MSTRHFAIEFYLPLCVVVSGCNPNVAAQPATVPPPAAPALQQVPGGNGVQLAIYRGGRADGTPILFIHGFSQNSMTWDAQLTAPLASQFHLVTFDMRGHGASAKPLDPAQYTNSAAWADDVDAIIREAELERPILVGWSYGGFVITDYVRKYGDSALGGIVLVGAITKLGTEEALSHLTPELLSIFGNVLSSDLRQSIDGTSAITRMFTRHGSPEWETAFGSAMIVPPAIRQAMFGRVLDNDDVLASIRVPTLVIQGAKDELVRMSAAQHLAATIPGARLLLYSGFGHAPHIEAPQLFNRDLADFVNGLQHRELR